MKNKLYWFLPDSQKLLSNKLHNHPMLDEIAIEGINEIQKIPEKDHNKGYFWIHSSKYGISMLVLKNKISYPFATGLFIIIHILPAKYNFNSESTPASIISEHIMEYYLNSYLTFWMKIRRLLCSLWYSKKFQYRRNEYILHSEFGTDYEIFIEENNNIPWMTQDETCIII